MTLLSDDMLNDASNKITAPTQEVVDKIEEPTIDDSYFTLGEAPSMEIEEEMEEEMEEESFELEEISEKEFEAEIDAEISIAAMSWMEELSPYESPAMEAVESTPELEEERVEEIEEEVVLFELQPEEDLSTTSVSSTGFILNKPTNIYAAEEEMEEDIFSEEALEEVIIEEVTPAEEMEEEDFMEEELMEEEMELTFATETPAETIMETPSLVEMVKEEEVEKPEAPVVVEYQSSFSMQEEPAMQLVMRDDEQPQPARPVHPSSLEMPLDNAEEQRRKVAERIQKLRNLSFNINNGPDPNTEFDAVPAYVRRNLDLFGNTLASVENYYSKYTVEKDENNQTQISTINTFLDGKKPD
jgi:cell division protein FtsZ